MKKKIIFSVFCILAIVFSIFLFFVNINRNEKKVLEKLKIANEKIQTQEQDLRKKCEEIGQYCYYNNVGSTLDNKGKANYDFILKTEAICNECTKACLQVFGLD